MSGKEFLKSHARFELAAKGVCINRIPVYLSACHVFGVAALWTILYWELVTSLGMLKLMVVWYRLATELTLVWFSDAHVTCSLQK